MVFRIAHNGRALPKAEALEAREPKVMTDEEIDRLIHEEPTVMCAGISEEWNCGAKAAFEYVRDNGYPAPLDRPHTGYTATECSEIARKRYADEPRKTFQQQQYAQGLEDGYGHALFEHIGK